MIRRGEVPRRSVKDIADEDFLGAVDEAIRLRSVVEGRKWWAATRWDVAAVLAGYPGDVGQQPRSHATVTERKMPERLVMAKARKLIARGLLDGCACGCRGDFERMRGIER